MCRRLAFRIAAAAAALAAAAVAGCGSGAAPAPPRAVPPGFMGVNSGLALGQPGVDLEAEFAGMAAAGVEAVRTGVFWADAQPYRTAAQVPAAQRARFPVRGGVPTDLAATDRFVAAAARHGLPVLPVVVTAPAWARRDPAQAASAPRGTSAYTRFLATLQARYGPKGSFWAGQPGLAPRPIRAWQIWNEPNHDYYWREQPFQRDYVRLLAASRRTLRAADPGARVVLAGLDARSWDLLASLYRAGAKGTFDVAALHPYTLEVGNVVRTLAFVRAVLRRDDPGRPIWITELGWPAAKGKVTSPFGFETTAAQAAANLRNAYTRLAAQRRALGLERVYWESWLTAYRSRQLSWDWAGLRRTAPGGSAPTPGLAAYREVARRLEGCAKGADATRCR